MALLNKTGLVPGVLAMGAGDRIAGSEVSAPVYLSAAGVVLTEEPG